MPEYRRVRARDGVEAFELTGDTYQLRGADGEIYHLARAKFEALFEPAENGKKRTREEK